MSLRQGIATVKNFVSNIFSKPQPQEGQEETVSGQSNVTLRQRLLNLAVTRKRPASALFEPEITDDEDDFGIPPTYQMYQPQSKRLRPESETMSSNKRKQEQQERIFSTRSVGTGEQGPSTSAAISESARSISIPITHHTHSKQLTGKENPSSSTLTDSGKRETPGPSTRKDIEVITLDDDNDKKLVLKESPSKSKDIINPGPSSRELSFLKSSMTRPMKQKQRVSRDSNVVSKALNSIGNKLKMTAQSAFRTQEKQNYMRLLEVYSKTAFNNTGMQFRFKALTKSVVPKDELEVLYNRTGTSPSQGHVSVRRSGRALMDPVCKPTTALMPIVPRLYSTISDYDSLNSTSTFETGASRPMLAIANVPEIIDLEAGPSTSSKTPISPAASKRKSIRFATPISPIKVPFARNFTNLQDALNSSGVVLDDDNEHESQRAIVPIKDTSVEQFDTSQNEEDEDISIIAEKNIRKSRNQLRNSLALEHESELYTKREWLEKLTSDFRENDKSRRDQIKEQELTRDIIHNESTLPRMLEERIRDKLTLTEIVVLEEPPEEMPELTEEMMQIIDNSRRRGNANEVLANVKLTKDTISITRGDISTLGPTQWLNDNVINTYMGLIVKRSKELDNLPTVYAFQTFFYPKLLKEGYSNSLKRWTRKDDIFAHDLIILPIHLGMHWCLACIDLRKKSIRYFDSLGGDNNKCLNSLLEYISKEMKERKQIDLNRSEWSLENVKGIPQQQNGSDCGMFSCKFAEYLSRDKDFTFGQQHMPYYRERMIYELVTATLMHP